MKAFEPHTINGTWELLSAEGDYGDDERIRLTPVTYTVVLPGSTTYTASFDDNYTYTYIIKIKNLTKDELNFEFEFVQDGGCGKDSTIGSKNFNEK